MRYLAPPGCVLTVDDVPPHTLSFTFAEGSGLTPTGIVNVQAAITTYLSAAKSNAVRSEWQRFGGPPALPAATVGQKVGAYPVLSADIATQVAALQVLIATPANAG